MMTNAYLTNRKIALLSIAMCVLALTVAFKIKKVTVKYMLCVISIALVYVTTLSITEMIKEIRGLV